MIRRFEYLWLILVVLLAFSVRLYRIDNPIADWHSWRQADTSAVSRNFLKFGFDPLHPRFDDLSNVASGKDNPQGYRFVEFPIYNAVSAGAANIAGTFPIEIWERLISILAALGSLVFLFFLVKKYLGRRVGLLTAFFFAVLPFNIYFGRTILPEASMVFTSLGMIYFFDKWVEGKSDIKDQKSKAPCIIKNYSYFILAVIFTAAGLLIKPYVLFLFLPLLYLAWRKWGIRLFIQPSLYLYILMSLAPFIWWRQWIIQFPEGIPASDWLFNAGNIRFKGAFFYWIFADRLGRLILGYFGVALLVLGLAIKRGERERWFFDVWLLSILTYFTVLAGGNVQHDYYQVIAIPIISVFLAKGANFLLSPPKEFNKSISYMLFAICSLFMLSFSWYHVRDFFNVNRGEIIEAGKAVDRLVPKNAKVIAPYGGDTAFLYQTNRQGWPVGFEIEDKIKKGANYYVNINISDPETDYVMKKYKVLEKTDKYVIVELTLQ
ncbi:MAG: glycosyltransferase family 39 protein [bacterium]|nr:glycosyltransferase family 39 protein [bacterium]